MFVDARPPRNLRLPWALVAGRASQLLVVGRKWRNRMFSERPGCSPHASSPWAWDQASAVYEKLLSQWRQGGAIGPRSYKERKKRRKIIVEKMGYLHQTTVVTRSSINKGRNLRPPWLLGPVSRKNSLNSFFSLYKNPIDLSLNPISSVKTALNRWIEIAFLRSEARVKPR